MANVLLYLSFLFGEALHILRRASMAGQSTANRHTLMSYLESAWMVMIVRVSIALALFSLWLEHPQMLSVVGIQLPFALVPYKSVAMLCGFFADSALDYIAQKFPWAGREVPTATTPAEIGTVATAKADGVKP